MAQSVTRSRFDSRGVCAALLIAFLFGGCSDGYEPGHRGGEVGMVVQDVPMRGMNGDIHRFAEIRGRPMLINVWASWCGPCRAEMASIENLSKIAPARFTVIGVSTDDDVNLAREFLLRSGVTFSNFHDADQYLEREVFGASAIPLTLLVDSDGRIVQRVLGARQWDSEESISLIETALGQRLR